ncbi:hypothetical protein MA16_Dca020644 [Dendrobium catenatum]|uniref:Uncharacterized protein n=1 Tax=Dendrobium catenatum TaxID=906689 RepID=A0A2I0WKT5_9ASPA|nr:hypothetical protein MA16_Dca020644 [Dendrobium catenatum]
MQVTVLVWLCGSYIWWTVFIWSSFCSTVYLVFQTWDRIFWECGCFVWPAHSSLLVDYISNISQVCFKDYGCNFAMDTAHTDDDELGLSLRAMEGHFGNLARFCGFFLTDWRHCDGQFCWDLLAASSSFVGNRCHRQVQFFLDSDIK